VTGEHPARPAGPQAAQRWLAPHGPGRRPLPLAAPMARVLLRCCAAVAATTNAVVTGPPPLPSLPPPRVACAGVQQRLNAAIARGDAEFQLPSGGIYCPEDFVVFDAQDLVLSGAADGSTTFWFDPRMAGFSVMHSRNVTVRRVAVDHDPLPYIQLEITQATKNVSSGAMEYEFEYGVRSLPLSALDGGWGAIAQWWLWAGVGAERWVKASPRFTLPKPSMFANKTGGGLKSLPGFPTLCARAVQGDGGALGAAGRGGPRAGGRGGGGGEEPADTKALVGYHAHAGATRSKGTR
jgi:hypothetical protein